MVHVYRTTTLTKDRYTVPPVYLILGYRPIFPKMREITIWAKAHFEVTLETKISHLSPRVPDMQRALQHPALGHPTKIATLKPSDAASLPVSLVVEDDDNMIDVDVSPFDFFDGATQSIDGLYIVDSGLFPTLVIEVNRIAHCHTFSQSSLPKVASAQLLPDEISIPSLARSLIAAFSE